jgi:hypothetical protein
MYPLTIATPKSFAPATPSFLALPIRGSQSLRGVMQQRLTGAIAEFIPAGIYRIHAVPSIGSLSNIDERISQREKQHRVAVHQG